MAENLSEAGHDAIHGSDLDLHSAPDEEVLQVARDTDRVVLTADADFGTILATTHATKPSVICMRGTEGRRVADLTERVVSAVKASGDSIAEGSLVVIEAGVLRIRRLPIL